MDREEYPALVESGETTTCLCDAPTVESTVNESCEPVDLGGAEPESRAPTLAEPPLTASVDEAADAVTLAQVVEALLFSADTPLSANRLAELSGLGSATEVRLGIADLNDKYAAAGLTFRIAEIARGYQMLSQPQFRPWLARLNKHQAATRLSAAALETLSIIAYKQPVIRADIEAIRGVGSGEILNRLREMGLIKIIGRAEIIGRPLLYGTTRKFLDVFGLADLDDLPPLETLTLRRPAPVAAAESRQPAEETPIAAAGA